MQKGVCPCRYAYDVSLVTLKVLTSFYSQSHVVSACQSFKHVTPFFFLVKVSFLAFLIQKRVWLYEQAHVTNSKYLGQTYRQTDRDSLLHFIVGIKMIYFQLIVFQLTCLLY